MLEYSARDSSDYPPIYAQIQSINKKIQQRQLRERELQDEIGDLVTSEGKIYRFDDAWICNTKKDTKINTPGAGGVGGVK